LCGIGGGGGGRGGTAKFELPSLRHVVHQTASPEESSTLLESLHHTLLSMTLSLATIPFLPASVFQNPSIALCFTIDIHKVYEPPERLSQARVLRLGVRSVLEDDTFLKEEAKVLKENWPSRIETSARLETLILPYPSTYIKAPYGGETCLEGILEVCRRRKIRVIYDERFLSRAFWDGASRWFIRDSEERQGCR